MHQPALKEVKANEVCVRFTRMHHAIERKITVSSNWLFSESRHLDAERIVLSETDRLIMEPGEMYTFRYSYYNKDARRKFDMPCIIMGTPYGTVAVSMDQPHESISFKSDFSGAHIVTTQEFKKAALRFMQKNQALVPTDPKCWGYSKPTLEKFIALWLVSKDFHEQINALAESERAAGMIVTDGLPKPIERKSVPKKPQQQKKAAQSKPKNNKGKPQPQQQKEQTVNTNTETDLVETQEKQDVAPVPVTVLDTASVNAVQEEAIPETPTAVAEEAPAASNGETPAEGQAAETGAEPEQQAA